MQLYALNQKGELVFAGQANKSEDLQCLECGEIVRRRAGLHRQTHFFHLRGSSSCALNGKGMAHLQIQNYLQKQLPQGDTALEQRFPDIGRIADLVWFSKKLVFEVQCSPISQEEILNRIQDYRSIGFETVWILHDRLYNQKRLKEAEQALKSRLYYFSNIDEEGRGIIYDQFDISKNGRRLAKLPPLPIKVTEPQKASQLYFTGDLYDLNSRAFSPEYLQNIAYMQKKFHTPLSKQLLFWLKQGLIRPYNLVLQMLLERTCR